MALFEAVVEEGDIAVFDPVVARGLRQGQGVADGVFGLGCPGGGSIELGEFVPEPGMVVFEGDSLL